MSEEIKVSDEAKAVASKYFDERVKMHTMIAIEVQKLLTQRDEEIAELRAALHEVEVRSRGNLINNGRCPCCDWVWTSSIDYKESHAEGCKFNAAMSKDAKGGV